MLASELAGILKLLIAQHGDLLVLDPNEYPVEEVSVVQMGDESTVFTIYSEGDDH